MMKAKAIRPGKQVTRIRFSSVPSGLSLYSVRVYSVQFQFRFVLFYFLLSIDIILGKLISVQIGFRSSHFDSGSV